jgi:hypothetical protein
MNKSYSTFVSYPIKISDIISITRQAPVSEYINRYCKYGSKREEKKRIKG